MPVFSPFAFLLIFLSIQLAPPSATLVTIHMDQYNRVILEKQNNGEWKRVDNDVVVPVSFKVEKTKLIAIGDDDRTQSVDLAEHYKITGDENWKDVKEISANSGSSAKLVHQDNKLVVESKVEDQEVKTEITWILKKEKE